MPTNDWGSFFQPVTKIFILGEKVGKMLKK
jgi:hypothetical protein